MHCSERAQAAKINNHCYSCLLFLPKPWLFATPNQVTSELSSRHWEVLDQRRISHDSRYLFLQRIWVCTQFELRLISFYVKEKRWKVVFSCLVKKEILSWHFLSLIIDLLGLVPTSILLYLPAETTGLSDHYRTGRVISESFKLKFSTYLTNCPFYAIFIIRYAW